MPKQIEPPNPTAAALVEIAAKAAEPEELEPGVRRAPVPKPGAFDAPELIGKVPAKKTNGPAPRENVQRGLAHFDQLEAERDQLDRELRDARLKISQLELQITEIENTRGTIESRINSCVLERDQAVREAGELRGALNSVAAICVRYHHAEQQD